MNRRDIPTTYAQANAMLAGQDDRTIANNTRLVRGSFPHPYATGRDISLRLHSTNVVTWRADGGITLNSGGYHTVTTKDRINRALRGTSYRVGAVHFDWYVYRNGQRVDSFEDGIALNP